MRHYDGSSQDALLSNGRNIHLGDAYENSECEKLLTARGEKAAEQSAV